MRMPTKLSALYAIIFLSFLGIIFIVLIVNITRPTTQTKTSPLPTPVQTNVHLAKPPSILSVPTVPYQQGGGVDKNSPLIQQSENEIKKLTPFLPYNKSFTLSTGIRVDIVIPQETLQQAPWTLTVNMEGIIYTVSPQNSTLYTKAEISFKEAASHVFDWIRSHGADPNKIIFVWGNSATDQAQAEQWLNQ